LTRWATISFSKKDCSMGSVNTEVHLAVSKGNAEDVRTDEVNIQISHENRLSKWHNRPHTSNVMK